MRTNLARECRVCGDGGGDFGVAPGIEHATSSSSQRAAAAEYRGRHARDEGGYVTVRYMIMAIVVLILFVWMVSAAIR